VSTHDVYNSLLGFGVATRMKTEIYLAPTVYAPRRRKKKSLKQAFERDTLIQDLNLSTSGIMSVKLLNQLVTLWSAIILCAFNSW
jgi:hypothetical protein